jgi:hypothetical protein
MLVHAKVAVGAMGVELDQEVRPYEAIVVPSMASSVVVFSTSGGATSIAQFTRSPVGKSKVKANVWKCG